MARLRAALTRPRDEARMTIIEHLDELRSRIIKVGVVFVAAAVVAWFFREDIFYFLLAPAGDSLHGQLNFTSVTEAVFADIKLALYTAFVFTIPVFLYQAWAFVAPAVGEMGRLFTYTLIALASSLFIAGVAFGYFVVLPIGVNFLLDWDPERYNALITSDRYMAFVTRFLLAFGIVFELPAATYVGAKLELINAPLLRKYRKHAIVVNALLAAGLTPGQDPFSMILMALPMILMYELSIIIARYVNPVSDVPELQEDYGGEEDERPPERVGGERDL
ncbi:Sec-independent protein translocase protein TatC [Rubrobacter xylanophilus DSM 9941]|uniref:twin-arginine translocase subunit TatC n=1 Tax=Rubrobacter xylanophilus TaxID=49319 RepID=UPI001C63CF35|nr:twin-arginine translocase subunit TatC [Rubrobacter xylanophilus]QYJ15104.1 Sec-independent protein translocase protein TatC [Rubrobacter xylanophilus DSM 9941]